MDIRILQYFLAVVREENITAAAESLHMTQPPLSKQLKELEEELGKTLFIRGKRKITLTEEGVLLRKRAEEMIDLMNITKAEIQAASSKVSGDVYIGCAETDAMRLLIKIIKLIQAEYPEVCFHLSSGNAEEITEKLDRGLLDFGVFIDPTNLNKYEFIKLPALDRWGLLMRKDSPLAEKTAITSKDLYNLPLIFTSQEMARNQFSGWSGGEFEKLKIAATYNLPFVASLMVEENIGYALVLDSIIQTAEGCPLCFRPLEPKLEVGISVGWKKNQVFSKAAKTFLQQFQQQIYEI